MTSMRRTAAITGAYGYLGSAIRGALDRAGWRTIALVRRPNTGDNDARRYDLARPIDADTLAGVDALIHCAYDLTLTKPLDIERVNVDGSRRLLEAAARSDVTSVVVLSSMSAYAGTTQLYGRAKLDIEAATREVGGWALRPGLVYGRHSGGMAASLRRLTKLPVIPIPAGRSRQFTVHEDDLAAAVIAALEVGSSPDGPLSVAHPVSVSFRDLLATFASWDRRDCRFLPVPWSPLYWALRMAEELRLKVPFRADSLLGLVRPAPAVVGAEHWDGLGVTFRALT